MTAITSNTSTVKQLPSEIKKGCCLKKNFTKLVKFIFRPLVWLANKSLTSRVKKVSPKSKTSGVTSNHWNLTRSSSSSITHTPVRISSQISLIDTDVPSTSSFLGEAKSSDPSNILNENKYNDPKVWKTYKPSSPNRLRDEIRELKKASKAELASGEFDKKINEILDDCLSANDRKSFRFLVHCLFSGERRTVWFTGKEKVLVLALNDPGTSLEQLSKLLLIVLNERKKEWSELEDSEEDESPVIHKEKPFRSWGGEELITVSHGGGWFYIKGFLNGLEKGYLDEGEFGKGRYAIYVSPDVDEDGSSRDRFYANKRCYHFDIPAAFKAKIPAKYIGRVTNGYEGFLIPEHVQFLQDIEIRKVKVSLDMCLEERHIQEIEDQELQEYFMARLSALQAFA